MQPLFESKCLKCHGGAKKKAGLDLRSLKAIEKGGDSGPAIVAGKPDESLLYKLVQPGADPHMPAKDDQLSSDEMTLLRVWIASLSDAPQVEAASPEIAQWSPPEGTTLNAAIDLKLGEYWQREGIELAPRCDDDAFVRRAYIDLAGRIPTIPERERFASSTEPEKRARLIDRLLEAPEFAKHMAAIFDVVFLDRDKKSERSERISNKWLAYLEWAFAKNRSWDQIAADLVLARPKTDHEVGASWFLGAKKNDHHRMATATTRALLGKHIQCAQCHDHPVSPEIEQRHYWGMVAFFDRSYPVKTPHGLRLGEAATGGYSEYKNLEGEAFQSALAFLNGATVAEKRNEGPDKADFYEVAPSSDFFQKEKNSGDKKGKRKGAPSMDEAPVPKESRRERLLQLLVRDNLDFSAAAVNRFWAYLLGRGIVHPVDQMDSSHPASHPQLLSWMALDFAKNGYNVRRLIRGVTASRAYQLGSASSQDPPPQPATFARMNPKPLPAEALSRSLLVASGRTPDEAGTFTGIEEDSYRNPMVERFPALFPEVVSPQVGQALFFTNNPLLDALTDPEGDNVAAQMIAESDPSVRTRLAFSNVLCRQPYPDELKKTSSYFEARSERAEDAVRQVLWALLASAEFRFNH